MIFLPRFRAFVFVVLPLQTFEFLLAGDEVVVQVAMGVGTILVAAVTTTARVGGATTTAMVGVVIGVITRF